MRIRLTIVAVGVLLVSISPAGGVVQATRQGDIRVAVFDDDGAVGDNDLVLLLNQEPGIHASLLTRDQVERGGLAFADCVITRAFGPTGPTRRTRDALAAFVAGGGDYVGEWWGAGLALSGAGRSFDQPYGTPARFLHTFSGLVSDGGLVDYDTQITIVADHPVVQGLPDMFSAGSGTEFFVRAVQPYSKDLQLLATYDGHGGTNPAIMVGPTGAGNAVLLFFDAMDNPLDPNVSTLFVNSVRWACAA